MTLTLLWQEYRAAHPDGYGYTWFCEQFATFRAPDERDIPQSACGGRGDADGLCRADGAGDRQPASSAAQIFDAVPGASNLTFAFASSSQKARSRC